MLIHMWGLVYCYEHVTRTSMERRITMYVCTLLSATTIFYMCLLTLLQISNVGIVNISHPKSLEHVTYTHIHTHKCTGDSEGEDAVFEETCAGE